MKVKEFGAWPLRNISTGGQQNSYDEYNRHLKGEPYRNYEEYASKGVEEYHHYPEQKDMTADRDEKKDSPSRRNNTRSRRMRIVQQAVVLVAGSIMITSAYQASVNPQKPAADTPAVAAATEPGDPSDDSDNNAILPSDSTQPSEGATQPTENATQPASTAPAQNRSSSAQDSGNNQNNPNTQNTTETTSEGYSISWSWSPDGSTATLVITDSSGQVISETPATVTASETPATCNTDGSITRTASAQYDGQTYTDARSETSPALGHSFDDGTEVTLSDGRTAMEFECARCHEHFTIVNSIDEE